MEFQARIVDADRGVYLVEWGQDGVPQRGYVDLSMLRDDPENPGYVLLSNAEEAIPYGADWAQLLTLSASLPDAHVFQVAMREAGLWKLEQAVANVPFVKQALARATSGTLTALLTRLTTEET